MKGNISTKVIYFDEETISNILIKKDEGIEQTSKISNKNLEAGMSTSISIKMNFLARFKFLFSSKMNANYILQEQTTLSSTILSKFNKEKKSFNNFENVCLSDIESSFTSYRIALMFAKIAKNELSNNGLDVRGMEDLFDNFEGYYIFKEDKDDKIIYYRFNMSSFLSNYKINEIKNSILNLSTIYIGELPKNNFNIMKTIEELNTSLDVVDETFKAYLNDTNTDEDIQENEDETIYLFDVVYAETIGEKYEQ
ncbi:hypothetical protein OKW23_001411 [Bacilli bacterium PM5-9]|nr:hypothetical protein [Bacilli bacterium PM5-9]